MPSEPRWGYQIHPLNLLPVPLPEADMTHQEFMADIRDSVVFNHDRIRHAQIATESRRGRAHADFD